ncbi:MAG: T9SS type A sorting domain-containing protein [Flavobacteriales bacterium]
MQRTTIAFCALLLPLLSLAQGTFQQNYDWMNQGTAYNNALSSVRKTSDGYLLGGGSQGEAFGAGLMHTDENGLPIWNKTYDINGDGFGAGDITNILPLPGGGCIVAGTGPELFYARVDADGEMLWAKRIPGNYNFATGLMLLSDGNILFSGKRQGNAYDAFLIKADLDGTVIWSQFYGTETENSEFFTSIVETPDHGFLCWGYRNHQTQYMDLLLAKLDANGTVEWSKLYGSSTIFTNLYSDDIRATADGNYVLTGSSFVALTVLNPTNTIEPLVLKVDPTGELLWSNKLDSVLSATGLGVTNFHVHNAILPDGSMRVLLSSVNVPSTGMQLIHADAMGLPLSANNLRNTQYSEYAKDMELLPDGSVAVTGYNHTGTAVASSFLMRTDPSGHTACNDSASTTNGHAFELPSGAGGVVASACTFSYTDITPAVTLNTVDAHNTCSGVGIHTAGILSLPTLSLQPNPANDVVRVSMEGLPAGAVSSVMVFNATGALVRTLTMEGSSTGLLNVQDLTPGIYMVRWNCTDGRSAQRKLTVVGAR